MIEPDHTEWQVRCAFNAFCKRVLKHEAINIYNERRQQQAKELAFSDLTQQQENQLYTLDKQYEGEVGVHLKVGFLNIVSLNPQCLYRCRFTKMSTLLHALVSFPQASILYC